MKMIGQADYVVIDTPARPHSDDLQEDEARLKIAWKDYQALGSEVMEVL